MIYLNICIWQMLLSKVTENYSKVDAFLGYQTQDLAVANTMLYCLNYWMNEYSSGSDHWWVENMKLKRMICSWTRRWLEGSYSRMDFSSHKTILWRRRLGIHSSAWVMWTTFMTVLWRFFVLLFNVIAWITMLTLYNILQNFSCYGQQ